LTVPDISDYLAAFGLTSGTIITGYQLQVFNAIEHSIRRYKEYGYSGELEFRPLAGANFQKLHQHFTSLINQTKEIRGSWDLYTCTLAITDIKQGPSTGDVLMILNGHALK
jgi:hypothetical protein